MLFMLILVTLEQGYIAFLKKKQESKIVKIHYLSRGTQLVSIHLIACADCNHYHCVKSK